ncbi:hypothetical protein [uncultured Shimia sp.]|uniref:ATP-grasp domain-containing protein n=1 Tax=uncultured Shimia sp. TaxID=573152 RepID=UPI0026027F7D|nr:hypothetical protein [uncultured Shimia sp.]
MEPQERIGLASLTKMAFDGVDLQPLRTELLSKVFTGKDADGIFMDLSVIDQLQGNRAAGLAWQEEALKRQQIFSTKKSDGARTKLLVFAEPSHIGGNTPIEFLLQDADVEILTYYLNVDSDAQIELPAHDVAFCAAPADSVKAVAFQAKVRALTEAAGTKVVNLPVGQVDLERDTLEKLFAGRGGLTLPKTQRFERVELQGDAGEERLAVFGDYPYVVRPVGSHAGEGLVLIESQAALAAYLAERAEATFYVSEFIPYATKEDGFYRKYRVIFVDGQPFPCHMAIADQWDLWYLNARMEEFAEKRAEEAAWMDSFDSTFANRHESGFGALTQAIDLDYFGVDCAEDPEGNLVVFEADNALIVHDMDDEEVFPYKSKHMNRIFDAFETLLEKNRREKTSVETDDPKPTRRLS